MPCVTSSVPPTQERCSVAPEIRIAREAGACFGVERALKMVREAAAATTGPIKTLGPLIHNPRVVGELGQAGVEVTEDAVQEPGTTLVLRTHGVSPQVEEAAKASGATVLDATCPFVKSVHRAAERLSAEGYQVVLVGEKGHPEVEATLAHAPGALVVSSADEARKVELGHKVGVVVQTTQSKQRLGEVVAVLVARVDELRVLNTICAATSGRQRAASALAAKASVMIVIGGRNSANTRRLAEICLTACPNTHHIESEAELDPAWFCDAALVGITAGASTPREHIEQVRAAIERMVGE